MDGQALQFDDATFDAGLSVLGIILFPDAECGLAEMRRVVRRHGRISIVTWTEPENYELAAELRVAIRSICPEQPAAPLLLSCATVTGLIFGRCSWLPASASRRS